MIIIAVCAVHIIHPKAFPVTSSMPNKDSAPATATGYNPTPPLVAAIENPPAMNPIKTPPKGTVKCSTDGMVAQNIATYINQMKTV